MWVIGVAGLAGSITALYNFHLNMMENIKEFVHKESAPIAHKVALREIKATVDSIYSVRENTIHVGLRYDPEAKKVRYTHTNGAMYRAFYDSAQDKWYFINDNNIPEWCK